VANTGQIEIEQAPGIRQVAILLMLIGGEASGSVLREMDAEEVQQITREIARIKTLAPEEAEEVLEEFYRMAVTQDCVGKGGVDKARQILIEAFGSEQAQAMLDRYSAGAYGDASRGFDALQSADPQRLADVIHGEHPQTVALVLSHLCRSQAAALLFTLPPDLQADVSLRMASEDQISPEVISKIAAVIGSKLTSLCDLTRDAYGGVHAVAEIFNQLDSSCRENILGNIGALNPGLRASIRDLMFLFDDLLLLGTKAIEAVLAGVDRKSFIVALQGSNDQFRTQLLKSMSQNTSEMLRVEIEAQGPAEIKEVEEAQRKVIAVVRQLENDGVISVKRPLEEPHVL